MGFASEENVEEPTDDEEKSPEVVPSLSVVYVDETKGVGEGGLVLSPGGKELDVGRAGGRFVLPLYPLPGCCSKPLLKK